jgi:soluble lytic murein transglycosylase-like protein
MNIPDLQQIAVTIAHKFELDPALVQSICHHESDGWKPWAVRYEPAFYRRYIESMKGLTSTEMHGRAHSYGLMQVMGQVARELGFDGEFLTELCDPAVSVTYGCRKLLQCLKRKDGDIEAALLDYNGGADPHYPKKVLQYYPKYNKGA